MGKWGSLRQGSHTHSNALLSLYSGVSGMSGSHSVQRYEERSAMFASIGPSQSLQSNGLSQNTMNSLSSNLKSELQSMMVRRVRVRWDLRKSSIYQFPPSNSPQDPRLEKADEQKSVFLPEHQ